MMEKKYWGARLCMVMAIATVMVLLCVQPTFAAKPSLKTETAMEVNPLYADIMDKSALRMMLPDAADIQSTAPVEAASVEEAADVVRQAMVNREGTAVVVMKLNKSWHDADFYDWVDDTLSPWVDDTVKSTIDGALVHTGNPKEGDYLAYQYGGYRFSSEFDLTDDEVIVTFTYTTAYYTTLAEEQVLDVLVNQVLDRLNLGGKNQVEKIRAIYDFICSHVEYDYVHLNDADYKYCYTAYAAMVDGTAVCQGYANLFYRLALEAGVDARIISGIGNGGPHGWNIVKIGSLYYNLDCTWDSTVYGVYGDFDHYEWYLLGKDFPDHTRDAKYDTAEFNTAYPMADEKYTGTGDEIVDPEPEDPDPEDGGDDEEELPTVKFAARCEDAYYYPGDVVSIIFSIEEPVKMRTMMFDEYIYDTDMFEYAGGKWLINGAVADSHPDSALIVVPSDKEQSGDVFVLYLRVIGDAVGTYSFSYSAYANGISDGVEVHLPVTHTDCSIEVTEYVELPGDMNGDEMVDSNDAILLLRHILRPERYPVMRNADVNGDGFTDTEDAIYLLRHVMNPTIYPISTVIINR